MKLLVCGLGPLPNDAAEQSPAGGSRTSQLAGSLREAGHEVHLLLRTLPGSSRKPSKRLSSRSVEGLAVTDVPWERLTGTGLLRRMFSAVRPDAVVGATFLGSYDAARLAASTPFWADLFGDPMAEAQAQALQTGSNRHVVQRWRMQRMVLRRADVISTVSDSQRLATLGQMAAVGRLSRQTAGYDLVRTIPFGLDQAPPRASEPMLRGPIVEAADFVVLWSGSYNVWTDEETLFEGLEGAMDAEERIRFVSTGGAVSGYDDQTYARFVSRISASPHRDRYHLLGWLPREKATAALYEADVGVVVERELYEGLLGTKTRVVEWMAAGLPALATTLSDLPRELANLGCCLPVAVGDPAFLSRQILAAARDPDRLSVVRDAASSYLAERLGRAKTCAPLLEWARAPMRAPDRESLRQHPLEGAFAVTQLSSRERLRLALEPVARWSGVKRWWLARKFRT